MCATASGRGGGRNAGPGSVPKVGEGRLWCRRVNIQDLRLCNKTTSDDLLWCCQHIRSPWVYTRIVHLANSGESREMTVENFWITLNSPPFQFSGKPMDYNRKTKQCVFLTSFQLLVICVISLYGVSRFLGSSAPSTQTVPDLFSHISSLLMGAIVQGLFMDQSANRKLSFLKYDGN